MGVPKPDPVITINGSEFAEILLTEEITGCAAAIPGTSIVAAAKSASVLANTIATNRARCGALKAERRFTVVPSFVKVLGIPRAKGKLETIRSF